MYCRSPKGMSVGAFQDLRTTLANMLEMRVNILNTHGHVLTYFVEPRRPKLATLAAQRDRALADGKLRMGHTVTRTRSSEALRETEGRAEPVSRFFYVFVDKYGYHCCARCGPVNYYILLLTPELIGATSISDAATQNLRITKRGSSLRPLCGVQYTEKLAGSLGNPPC